MNCGQAIIIWVCLRRFWQAGGKTCGYTYTPDKAGRALPKKHGQERGNHEQQSGILQGLLLCGSNGKHHPGGGKALHSQPAVSQAVRQLEQSLDSQLFLRTSKGVRLTREGEFFYHYVKKRFIESIWNGGKHVKGA